jgi:pilus assembly protein Flp/PilA
MLSIFRKLLKDEQGATAIEYGLIAALISVAAITAFTTVGTNLNTKMNAVGNAMN